MKRLFVIIILMSVLIISTSCSSPDSSQSIQATQTVQAQVDSLVSEGVAATLTAMPTPTAVPIADMSEEDLAAGIEVSTNEAVAASNEAAQYADTASSDGELTREELDELYYLYYWSIEELEQALYLMDLYYDLYDELIDEALVVLESLDDDLEQLLVYTESILAYLDQFAQVIAQGGQVLQENYAEFQEKLAELPEKLSPISDALPQWLQTRDQELALLVQDMLAVMPDDIAGTRREALTQVKDYIAGLSGAIADGVFSISELESLSQLGANAAASAGQFRGDFAGISEMINGLTSSFARGQLPQINAGIGNLQGALPSIR